MMPVGLLLFPLLSVQSTKSFFLCQETSQGSGLLHTFFIYLFTSIYLNIDL